MTFKSDYQAKLEGGTGHQDLKDLLAVVRRYKAGGLSQRDAYNQLQELWLEYGFDDDDHDSANPIRDNLEYVMEIVWGYCPAGAGIWEDSLSKQGQPT